jgi:ubiquinone/menaquinone biosynthesis C-methylase UbiE
MSFDKDAIVRKYSKDSYLFPSERSMLRELKSHPKRSMLDLGVGAGRTTQFFAPLFDRYIGLDLSRKMIKAARETHKNHEFIVGDAASLPFPDNSFDFVLFSYNGIDYLTHKKRLSALREIRRVMKKGSSFLFSTHNINGKEPIRSLRTAAFALIRTAILPRKGWAIIRDGTGMFRIRTYYISPTEQLKQLDRAGFRDVRGFGMDGKPCGKNPTDLWIHLSCRK